MGIDAVPVDSSEEARAVLQQGRRRLRALAFPPEADLAQIEQICTDVAARDPESPHASLFAIGRKPAPERLADLHRAGVRFAVWNLDDGSALRFVANAALTLPKEMVERSEPRAPVDLLASFEANGLPAQAVVYTLSSRGAFLETPRPLAKGSSTRVTIRLPDQVIAARALTIHSNHPEDLLASRWPIGMSVLFGALSPASEAALRRFVVERLAQITIE
jgi:hypothetical protein